MPTPAFPVLRIQEDVFKTNCERMLRKATSSNTRFRPHFKTHQSIHLANCFREQGIAQITVSSLKMAEYFVDDGWDDVFIAFPFNPLEKAALISLAKIVRLHVSIDSPEALDHLDALKDAGMGIYLKIDTGYHRSGLQPDDLRTLDSMLNQIHRMEGLHFTGFYTHAGHTYHARNPKEINRIHRQSVSKLNELKIRYASHFPDLIVSIGDTPSCSLATDFSNVDEIRPGNFVFYDLMQARLGACTFKDIAVVLEAPVVGIYPDRNEFVVKAGAVHLSKERLEWEGQEVFGLVCQRTGNWWGDPLPKTFVKSLSQEHGIVQSSPQFIQTLRLGDTLGILPVHSCLTANLADKFTTMDGRILTKMRS